MLLRHFQKVNNANATLLGVAARKALNAESICDCYLSCWHLNDARKKSKKVKKKCLNFCKGQNGSAADIKCFKGGINIYVNSCAFHRHVLNKFIKKYATKVHKTQCLWSHVAYTTRKPKSKSSTQTVKFYIILDVINAKSMPTNFGTNLFESFAAPACQKLFTVRCVGCVT